MHTPLGELVPEAGEIKRRLTRALTIVNQRIKYPEQAETILAEGKSDLISMARAFIADPAFVSKIQQGRPASIRLCIGCNQECFGRLARKTSISCLQNPAVGRENEWADHRLRSATDSLRVAVIGGGPAGMKVAEIAAQRGHRVSLYEAEAELGGQVRLAARAPFREEFGEIASYLAGQLERLRVEISLGRRISAEEILALEPDVVIVATGSQPVAPTLPALSHCSLYSVRDVLDDREVGQHALVLDADGHWAGLSAAEYLVQRGKKVTFVTSMPMLAPDIPTAGDRVAALRRLYPRGVRFLTGFSVGAVEGKDVVLVNPLSATKKRVEGVDAIVFAGNNRADDALYRSLKGRVRALHCIGDSAAPRRASDAIFDGQRVGAMI
jgi:NADPH-dependent 2,4-dienoyl-CoA reductase/sulfur reductase-like enzyme